VAGIAALLVAGIAWAWSASTVNTAQVTAATLTAPGSPSAVRTGGSGNTCTAINVTWSAVPGATSYRVERNVDGAWVELAPSHVTTSYGDSGTWTHWEIQYRITARAGNWTAATSAMASIACGIGDVDDLTYTFAPSCIATQLNWTAPLGPVTGYDVEYRMNAGAWTAVPGATDIAATSFNDTTVYTTAPHGDLEYRVVARNGATTGNASNVVAPTTDYGCLLPPTNVAAAGCVIADRTVSWTAAATPVNGYDVRRRINGSGGFTTVQSNVGGTSWNDTTSVTLGQLVEYNLYSRNGTLIDNVASSTASMPSGFYVESIQFVGNTNGSLDATEQLVVTFSQPTSATFAPLGTLMGGANGNNTKGLWIAASNDTAGATDIGRLKTSGNNQFSRNKTATGSWQPNTARTVWTWTVSTTGGLTMDANPAAYVTDFGQPAAATAVKCHDTTTGVDAQLPTITGRW
jgi:hypothetical protein